MFFLKKEKKKEKEFKNTHIRTDLKKDEDSMLSKTETLSSLPPLYPNGFSLVVNMSLQFYYFTHFCAALKLQFNNSNHIINTEIGERLEWLF